MVLLAPVSACDSLLEVEDPDVLRPPQLEGAAAIPTLIAGAILDFQIAFNGNFNNSTVAAIGLMTDEYVHAETFPDRLEVDKRNIDRTDNGIILGVYSGLHVARTSARAAAVSIQTYDAQNANLPLVRSLEGFAEVLLGEAFCAGVPRSELVGNVLEYGQPRTTAEVFQDAVSAFDQALAANAASNTARVGKARALLNLGQFTAAAAAAAPVPTSFREFVRHSSTTASQNNGIWALATNGRISVAEREGANGVPFRSLNDPRVPYERSGFGFDETTPLYLPLALTEIDANVVLASGIEARLIQAEAALRDGNRVQFFANHNAARATLGLGDLTDSGQTTAALEDLHFRERALWLYSTGHRLGDMRRLVRQYNRNAASVFPDGPYFKGGSYGVDVNFPIPIEEDNNPNTSPLQNGCLNRGA
jgi:hypothetical protein